MLGEHSVSMDFSTPLEWMPFSCPPAVVCEIVHMSRQIFCGESSALCCALRFLKEVDWLQGVDPDEALDESGAVVGDVVLDYDTGLPLAYEDYVAAMAPNPIVLTIEEIGVYEDYENIPDPEFLVANDEWLAKVRQVQISQPHIPHTLRFAESLCNHSEVGSFAAAVFLVLMICTTWNCFILIIASV
jgi:hypothetical protein